VAEDDAFSLVCMMAQIEMCGLEADSAVNGKIAVDTFKDSLKCHPYRIILMDVNMPIMNGLDASIEINKEINAYNLMQRQQGKSKRIVKLPIVACTANTTYEDRKKCKAAGMSKFMHKPLQVPEL